MNKRPVIIDCDPGIDDAIALLLAFRAPELDVRAVTPVAGNVGLANTRRNALRVAALAGVEVPVCPGADRPMFGTPVTADEFHGADGMMGFPLPDPAYPAREERAWDALYREAAACEGGLDVIATGPLTNLGIAFSKYGDLPGRLHRIVLMGGAASYGNTTPAAEFNILADPEAAEIVFRSGVPIHMCGLDVTHRAYLDAGEIAALAAQGTPQAEFAAQVMESAVQWHWTTFGVPGAPMHDACAMMYTLEPDLFTSAHCWVGVECQGRITRGKTVTDLYSDAKREASTELVTDVDREKFVRSLQTRLFAYK